LIAGAITGSKIVDPVTVTVHPVVANAIAVCIHEIVGKGAGNTPTTLAKLHSGAITGSKIVDPITVIVYPVVAYAIAVLVDEILVLSGGVSIPVTGRACGHSAGNGFLCKRNDGYNQHQGHG
jgi:hypothetical protein